MFCGSLTAGGCPVHRSHQERTHQGGQGHHGHRQVNDPAPPQQHLPVVEEVPPLFEGAETMYKADLIATGFAAPVRARYITDVTNLKRGHLSNEILRNIEFNHTGLGEHLRDDLRRREVVRIHPQRDGAGCEGGALHELVTRAGARGDRDRRRRRAVRSRPGSTA